MDILISYSNSPLSKKKVVEYKIKRLTSSSPSSTTSSPSPSSSSTTSSSTTSSSNPNTGISVVNLDLLEKCDQINVNFQISRKKLKNLMDALEKV